MLLLMPSEISVLVACARLRPSVSVMISLCLGSASHAKNGQPVMVCPYRTKRFNSVISVKSPHLHRALHGPSRSMPRSVLSQTFAEVSHQPISRNCHNNGTVWCPCWRLQFHIFSVSMTIAAKFAAASRVPYLFLSRSPHQPDLFRSGSNSTKTRLLDGE